MNSYNEIESEMLRIEKLIEEREEYENTFFSMEDILKSEELDYAIPQYDFNQNFINEHFDHEYELLESLEDYFDNLRDEKLIEEREDYELNYHDIDLDYFALNDFYDLQIAAREEERFIEDCQDYVYDEYEEEMFWHLHYLKQSQFATPPCGCAYLDYMPNDDGLCDYLDCYDYPEGPDENLSGIKLY